MKKIHMNNQLNEICYKLIPKEEENAAKYRVP